MKCLFNRRTAAAHWRVVNIFIMNNMRVGGVKSLVIFFFFLLFILFRFSLHPTVWRKSKMRHSPHHSRSIHTYKPRYITQFIFRIQRFQTEIVRAARHKRHPKRKCIDTIFFSCICSGCKQRRWKINCENSFEYFVRYWWNANVFFSCGSNSLPSCVGNNV